MYELGYIFMDYDLLKDYFKKTHIIQNVKYDYFIIK
jgi:hypothetical protein